MLIAFLIWWNQGPDLGEGQLKDFDPGSFSQDMLYATKTDGDVASYLDTLANVNLAFLADQLSNDSHRVAFWLNIYNAMTQVLLSSDSTLAEKRFYSDALLNIGGSKISLDLIENGILRKSQMKLGLGYLSKWFPSRFEKLFVVAKRDPRIHFALNCGATSCPPISSYNPNGLEEQLEMATRSYLNAEVSYSSKNKKVQVPAIMSWFRGDFGGKSGIIDFLKQYEVIPGAESPQIEFTEFDWTLKLNNYKNQRSG